MTHLVWSCGSALLREVLPRFRVHQFSESYKCISRDPLNICKQCFYKVTTLFHLFILFLSICFISNRFDKYKNNHLPQGRCKELGHSSFPNPQPPTHATPPASRGSCVVSFTFRRIRFIDTRWSITYWSCSHNPKLIFCLLPQSINSCIYSGCFDGHWAIFFLFHVSEVYDVTSDNAILGRSRNRFPFQ